MTKPMVVLARAGLFAAIGVHAAWPAAACPELLNRDMPRLQDEKPQSLCQHAGKVVVVVNTASFCGYTPQYKGLEALQTRYGPRGLVVLGFPSERLRQAGAGHEQGHRRLLREHLRRQVSDVREVACGGDSGAASTRCSPTCASAPVSRRKWNFHKYLIARDGRSVQSFASDVEPQSAIFVRTIEKLAGRQIAPVRGPQEVEGRPVVIAYKTDRRDRVMPRNSTSAFASKRAWRDAGDAPCSTTHHGFCVAQPAGIPG
jgi:glutathione peroxidase